jgi:hypothetical protein
MLGGGHVSLTARHPRVLDEAVDLVRIGEAVDVQQRPQIRGGNADLAALDALHLGQ